MARYGGDALTEKLMHDELWSGQESFQLEYKNKERVKFIKPRPQIFLATHAHSMVDMLNGRIKFMMLI